MSKKDRFLGNTNLSLEIAQSIKEGKEQFGEINTEYVPLDRIETDPENPRITGFTKESILTFDENECTDQNLIKNWHAIKDLSISIKSTGLLHAIRIYRHRDKFLIAYGERRFLATVLLGQPKIMASILDEPPKNLRIQQFVENFHRADISSWERIRSMDAIIKATKMEMMDLNITTTYLKENAAISRSQAFVYLSIINGPEDIKNLLQEGRLTNLDKAGYLSKIVDDEKRAAAIEMVLKGLDIKDIDAYLSEGRPKKNKSPSSKTGRPISSINLGKTTKIHIIKKIILTVAASEKALIDLDNINWSDVKSVTKNWKLFLKSLELETDIENE